MTEEVPGLSVAASLSLYAFIVYIAIGPVILTCILVLLLNWKNKRSKNSNSEIEAIIEPKHRHLKASDLLSGWPLVLWSIPFGLLVAEIVSIEIWHRHPPIGSTIGSYDEGMRMIFFVINEFIMSFWCVFYVILWRVLKVKKVSNAGFHIYLIFVLMNILWFIPQLFPGHPFNVFLINENNAFPAYSSVETIGILLLASFGALMSLILTRNKTRRELRWSMLALTAPLIIFVWMKRELIWFILVMDPIIAMIMLGYAISREYTRIVVKSQTRLNSTFTSMMTIR